MARAVREVWGPRVVEAVVVTPGGQALADGESWRGIEATHPVPSEASEEAGRAALALADRCASAGETLLACLSGGASAMLAVPVDGVTIEEKARATELLLGSGLPIADLNLVRRHLSAIKGGQLAARARQSVTLAISDVHVADEEAPAVIASGPTVGGLSTPAQAVAVLEASGLAGRMPAGVMAHLTSAAAVTGIQRPVAPGDPRLAAAAYWIIASRHDAMQGAATAARRLGYDVRVLEPAVVGPASRAWPPLLTAGRAMNRPAAIVASGETVVQVTGTGRGGRNQELVLGALEAVGALDPAAFASIGTDGVDGPTDAAGALVDSEMWSLLGLDAAARRDRALAANDAYPLLDGLGALIRIGPTGTNVGDLMVLLLPATRGAA